jgi:hypothetical protein
MQTLIDPVTVGPEAQDDLRGTLFTELDRLAFALEMEAAEHLRHGRNDEYARAQERRLGVRLAQRLVSGVPADEVQHRIWKWGDAYEQRLRGGTGGAPSEAG